MERRGFWAVALVALAACQVEKPHNPRVPIGPALVPDHRWRARWREFGVLLAVAHGPATDQSPELQRGRSERRAAAGHLHLRPERHDAGAGHTHDTHARPAATRLPSWASFPGFHVIAADDDMGQYHQFWKVPNSQRHVLSHPRQGRIDSSLAVADVQTSNRLLDLLSVNKNLFTTAARWRTNMLIRFRIEQYALCPITRNCASEAVNLALGGNVTTPLPGTGDGGVDIPPQGAGPTTTITVKPCERQIPASPT